MIVEDAVSDQQLPIRRLSEIHSSAHTYIRFILITIMIIVMRCLALLQYVNSSWAQHLKLIVIILPISVKKACCRALASWLSFTLQTSCLNQYFQSRKLCKFLSFFFSFFGIFSWLSRKKNCYYHCEGDFQTFLFITLFNLTFPLNFSQKLKSKLKIKSKIYICIVMESGKNWIFWSSSIFWDIFERRCHRIEFCRAINFSSKVLIELKTMIIIINELIIDLKMCKLAKMSAKEEFAIDILFLPTS